MKPIYTITLYVLNDDATCTVGWHLTNGGILDLRGRVAGVRTTNSMLDDALLQAQKAYTKAVQRISSDGP